MMSKFRQTGSGLDGAQFGFGIVTSIIISSQTYFAI